MSEQAQSQTNETQKKIKVRRTVTFTYESPLNIMYYPDMSQDEAVEFERNTKLDEMLGGVDYDIERDMITVTVLDEV